MIRLARSWRSAGGVSRTAYSTIIFSTSNQGKAAPREPESGSRIREPERAEESGYCACVVWHPF